MSKNIRSPNISQNQDETKKKPFLRDLKDF